jgi:hypothetical protein
MPRYATAGFCVLLRMFVFFLLCKTTGICTVRMRVSQEISLGPYEYIFGSLIYISFNNRISLYGHSTTVGPNPCQNGDTYPVMEQAFH